MIYLDANASEPLRPEAYAAATQAMEAGGNPASLHLAGRRARKILETAREQVAAFTLARPADVIFCAGATEANALAIHTLGAGRPILIGATEHDAIRAAAPKALSIPVLPSGELDLNALNMALNQTHQPLVCLMAANNETGVLHDIEKIAQLCAKANALLHVDAVQAIGRANQDWLGMGVTSFALSGHKFGGPPGAGALIIRSGIEVTPLIKGGGQELGRRGGTPALSAIAGLAAALGTAYEAEQITALRDDLEAFCIKNGALVVGQNAPRLPNTSCLILPGIRAETQLIALDMAGICVSAGSACSSGKVNASHVLLAMGYDAQAGQAIRVSLPWNVTPKDVHNFKIAYASMAARTLQKGVQSA